MKDLFFYPTGMLIMCDTCSLQENEKVDCIKHCIICKYRNAVRLTGTNIKIYKQICKFASPLAHMH